eukprot:5770544-Prymnesium_polylepis.1
MYCYSYKSPSPRAEMCLDSCQRVLCVVLCVTVSKCTVVSTVTGRRGAKAVRCTAVRRTRARRRRSRGPVNPARSPCATVSLRHSSTDPPGAHH